MVAPLGWGVRSVPLLVVPWLSLCLGLQFLLGNMRPGINRASYVGREVLRSSCAGMSVLFGYRPGGGGVCDPRSRGIRQHQCERLIVLAVTVAEQVHPYCLRPLSHREGEGAGLSRVVAARGGGAVLGGVTPR